LAGDVISFLSSVLNGIQSGDDFISAELLESFLEFLKWLSGRSTALSTVPVVFEVSSILFQILPAVSESAARATLLILANLFIDCAGDPNFYPVFIEQQFHTMLLSFIGAANHESLLSSVFGCLSALVHSLVDPTIEHLGEVADSVLNWANENFCVPVVDRFALEILNLLVFKCRDISEMIIPNPFFPRVFDYFQVDSPCAFYALKLVYRLLCDDTQDFAPVLELINWESLQSFIHLPEGEDPLRVEMLRMSSALVSKGPVFVQRFLDNGIFDEIAAAFDNLSFASRSLAITALSAAIITGVIEQQVVFSEIGSLGPLLDVTQESDSEEILGQVLVAIRTLAAAAETLERSEEFAETFLELDGFRILMELEACSDLAQSINDMIADPR
jgi:hypothetical protein